MHVQFVHSPEIKILNLKENKTRLELNSLWYAFIDLTSRQQKETN